MARGLAFRGESIGPAADKRMGRVRMTFQESIRECFSKYADFSGRARRSEYWWFMLFVVVVSLVLSMVSNTVSSIFTLATLLPSIAAAARRLHDTNRSGWWQLISLVPVIGLIVLIVFLAQEGKPQAALLEA
jgi:uncharacterized membrane protein YhaH (DUF805 family)